MSKTESKGRAQYEKAREAFTKLDMQDKAAFVLEATFSTFGEAFKDAGQTFSEVMDKVASEDFFSSFSSGSNEEEEVVEEKPKAKSSSSKSKKKKDEDAD